jgi:hypothetical protein
MAESGRKPSWMVPAVVALFLALFIAIAFIGGRVGS